MQSLQNGSHIFPGRLILEKIITNIANVILLCMKKIEIKRFLALHVLVFIFISQSVLATPASSPKIGIVIAKTSFDNKWEITQMSAFAWTGLVNLAGIHRSSTEFWFRHIINL